MLVAALLGVVGVSSAQAAETIDYATQVKPILQKRCYACHGALKQEAESAAGHGPAMIKGGDTARPSSPAIPPPAC